MRLALGIEYEGTDFLGWQRLSHGRTLQAALEDALGFVADQPVEAVAAGRTDAGVHAICQVVHFDAPVMRPLHGWLRGANTRLPHSMAVRWVREVSDDFHARYSARARRYRYRLLNREVRPALHARSMSWERLPLDAEAMHAAAQTLLGEHDFSAFRAAQCQARHPRRCVQRVAVSRCGDCVQIDIRANAFLHHMVRNIVGSLLPVGRGQRPPEWIAELLQGGDRRLAAPTAPAAGLTFIGPLYPPGFGLPDEATLDINTAAETP
ncbi:MAG: tRNA pseudouridine(38-40) synthase TruA [Lysobacteraceae bacterium]